MSATAPGRTGSRARVGVVVPTHDRPELLRATLRSVLAQDVPGPLEVVVVYDRNTPDTSLEDLGTAERRVRVVANSRTPGLAGARNTGILALDTEWVAFCDDDDVWLPEKLRRQLERVERRPEAHVVTTSICVVYDGALEIPRLAGQDRILHQDLLRGRMAMLHSSGLLLRHSALLGPIGLVDEEIPGSQGEDWDLLLRAAAVAPVEHVDEPLVRVRWGAASHFSRNWQIQVDAIHYLLRRHPGLVDDDRGAARLFGQLAFGCAALGRRAAATRWALRAVRRRWQEPRSVLALAVAGGVVAPDRVLTVLNRRGRGL